MSDATLERLDDQIGWYDARAGSNQKKFKLFKLIGMVCAAAIPVLASLDLHNAILGALGALVATLEGIQQLNQYHANWMSYRSTCEALKHEKYLHLAQAAHYASALNPSALLAERVESLVSQEHAKWASSEATKPAAKT